MYKITCYDRDHQEYLVGIRAALSISTCFLVEVEIDWSPLFGADKDGILRHNGMELEKLLARGEPPVILNYGKEMLAAFTEKQIHFAWYTAKAAEIRKTGPCLLLETLQIWERMSDDEWVPVELPT